MLIDQVCFLLAVKRFICRVTHRSALIESTERAEEAHDLGLAKDAGEHLEVSAEARETFEVHQRTVESVVLEEWHHGTMHAAQDVHNLGVFENLHQVQDLTLRVVTLLCLLNGTVE